jgi:GntR family transcriptional repressor for pyruvate dehydrogenase complex
MSADREPAAPRVRPAEALAGDLDATPGRARAYESIVLHVQQLVEEGALKPGDKLPSERDLGERFGVGRSSVRDAIRILEVKGIVRSRQGGGTVVQSLSPDSLVSLFADIVIRKRALVDELMDVRRIIEPALAARAAVNASPEQIAELKEILARQRDKVRRGEPAVEEDFRFHNAIARAAGNSVVLAVLDTLINLLAETRQRTLQVTGRPEVSLAGHRRVLRAIERRSPEAAEDAMRRHIGAIAGLIAKKKRGRAQAPDAA